MRFLNVFSFLALLCMVAGGALAADVSGKWTAEVPGRGGQLQTTTFNFKVEAGKLTGTVTSPRGETAISDGKVEGDNISFVQVINFNGNEFKITYKGVVSGNEIKFTRQMGDRGSSEFVAKRA